MPTLKDALDRVYADFDKAGRISDPIECVRPFTSPRDREIAGFFAAGLAFGRVAGILASLDAVFRVMGASPSRFVATFQPERDAACFDGIGHRWIRGRDLAATTWILNRLIHQFGTIEACFLDADQPDAPDIEPGLNGLCRQARLVDLAPIYGCVPDRPAVYGLFPAPSSGSACKRLNLYLRWMVRRDGVDLGVWRAVSPARLIVPLDVHVVRVARCLGLTRRTSANWKMAAEITAGLRRFAPDDPVRYDFALCHIGMHGACGFRQTQGDASCPLRGFCQPGPRTRQASPPPSDQP